MAIRLHKDITGITIDILLFLSSPNQSLPSVLSVLEKLSLIFGYKIKADTVNLRPCQEAA